MKKFYKIFKNSDGDVEVQTLHLRRPGYPVTSRQVFTAAEVMVAPDAAVIIATRRG